VRVLGIETSCDDTAVAIVAEGAVVAERTITQEAHRRYLGVVPEIASRAHLELLFPLVDEVLEKAGMSTRDIDAVAATCGPGLVGCLLVGVSTAKALAHALDVPVVGVNHIEGHLFSAHLEHDVGEPFLGLVVSGGHTEYALTSDVGGGFEILGSTRDDAAGEAFDKVAKLLGLGYPGGREIDRAARTGDASITRFPRAMMRPEDGCDVSFSGLKTAVRSFVAAHPGGLDDPHFVASVSAAFQEAVVDVLLAKLERALERAGVDDVVVAGGVACNSMLRSELHDFAKRRGVAVHLPSPRYCGDNAAMIAWVGERLAKARRFSDLSLGAYASLEAISAAQPVRTRR